MRSSFLLCSLCVSVLLPVAAQAQTHAVEKPESVVRAIAVYEWTGEKDKPTASRIIPVSIFVDGRLRDAGIYLARPVPLALDTGTIFEVEQAGEHEGTLELAFARSLKTTGDQENDDGWFGFGVYKPAVNPKPSKAHGGPISPVIVSGGKGPHFSGKGDVSSGASEASGSRAGAKPAQPVDRSDAASGKVITDPEDHAEVDPDSAKGNPDRPTLRRRTPEQKKAAQKKGAEAAVTGIGSLNDDPDRPILHRGREKTPEEELLPLLGIPAGMQRAVAVSDAMDRPSHDFRLVWDDDTERAEVLGQMQSLARGRLAEYAAHDLAPPAADAVPSKPLHAAKSAVVRTHPIRHAERRQAAASATPLPLTEEALAAFSLSYGGDPTFVYTAASPRDQGKTLYVTVVAQRVASYGQADGAGRTNTLKVALISVTDSTHLDRTPRMLLVDAVDAQASNRASLLFDLRAQTTRQFALYSVVGAQAEQTFATDNIPNGAAARGTTLLRHP
jgi:hypothetical protein